ncbi:MAG: selenium-dependent xanthine dehydrogenase [Eubacteriaceae bacterium]
MYQFTVNGKPVSTDKERKLMTFLRDTLDLTSVKNGCSEGACGTCMVLVDGKATKACILTTAKAHGKNIITVEGLSPKEAAVYGYAFGKAGAVQCGFCTPGMVICAKGLIDRVPNPTPEEVKECIKNNICRCTGYVKIEEAILLAGKILRENLPIPEAKNSVSVGENLLRVDAIGKTLGKTQYCDDIKMDGLLLGSAVRSQYPRAIVKSIELTAAKEVPGVVAVVTAEDIPGQQKIGHLVQDWDVLIPVGGMTHFLGDAIVLIAAETTEALEKAKALVNIDYEILTPVTSPIEAKAENAPLVHEAGNLLSRQSLVRGNADAEIAKAPYVVTNQYVTPFTEHAFLEPETAVATPSKDGGITIYSGDQGIYQTRHECADVLGLPQEKVQVIAKAVGGGFGGKEDMSVQHHAALLAYLTKRPVKVSLTRKESILIHPKRHAMTLEFTTACDENGQLTALKARIVSDTGAYASLGGPVLQRACTHAGGPYNYQNVDIVGEAYYTNNPPAGAFRGFGVSQSCFAIECNLNQLAEKVGISPWEMRYRNALRPGQVLPNGQIADASTAIVATLEAVKPYYDANPKAGIACAIKNAGIGVGIPDVGRCRIVVKDGVAYIRTSAACIGQGLGTVMVQIVCEVTGLREDQVVHDVLDTDLVPDSGNTTASRQTVFTGEATKLAALDLKSALEGKTLATLNDDEFYGEYSSTTDRMGTDTPNPISHVAYGYATQLVELDDDGKLKRVVAAHDVGRAINPISVEGQIEGGVVMGLGYGLTEDYPLENCMPKAKYGTLGLFKSTQVPELVSIIIEQNDSTLACGAKGVGEITTIPTAPAVQLAYYNFDGQFRTTLPLENTPYSKKKK